MTPLRLLSISDVHFGNTRIEPDVLASSFRRHVLPRLAQIDLLIVAGDFFDTALGLSDTITPSVLSVMFDLLQEAALHGVIVRFLRGTFSHERTQCQYFPMLHQQQGFTNDLKYYDTITLEYIKQLDLKLLYLPDDIPYPNSDEVIRVVHHKMRELGWTQVDYAIVHGYFDHVVPVGIHMPKGTYKRSQFDFVTRYVLIGHVHTPSIVDKFIYNGSFDRLAHGEEEPKGFMMIDDNGITAHLHFIPNPDATIFKTLDYQTITDEETLVRDFSQVVQAYPTDKISYVRIIHPQYAWRHALLKYARSQYPQIHLSVKAPAELIAPAFVEQHPVIDFTTYAKPTEETLPSLILEHGDPTTKPVLLSEERIRDYLRRAALP